jgi:tRNA(fMet)-specific endonuclease VapC
MRYLIDTDWLIDALSGISSAVRTLDQLKADGLAVSIISVGEVYEGAYDAANPAERLAVYRSFLAPFPVLPLSDRIMERFAQERSVLRKQGNIIPDLDLLIAATALEHNLTLLSRNIQHFDRITDLTLYQQN